MTWSAECFDRLGEVVAAAARYGPTPGLEAEYGELRLSALHELGQNAELRDWWSGDFSQQVLSPPTLDGLLNACGDKWSQRIESLRTSLGVGLASADGQAVH